ncbi:MAG TPA: hypothetical protein VMA36_02855 [Candidatus Limnocylindria bacterium]|jgi:hypothetical protein|nr:hypothetical protein [Candidatus Limnocylindria bacterium]
MRFSGLVLALLLGLATVGAPLIAQAQQQQQQQMQTVTSANGTWDVSATGPHFRSGSYQIQQVNQTVIGTNTSGGQMHGTMKSVNYVEGTWKGPSGETGWFNMHITPDGKSFSGQYGYGGRKPEGSLIGHRTTTAPSGKTQ